MNTGRSPPSLPIPPDTFIPKDSSGFYQWKERPDRQTDEQRNKESDTERERQLKLSNI